MALSLSLQVQFLISEAVSVEGLPWAVPVDKGAGRDGACVHEDTKSGHRFSAPSTSLLSPRSGSLLYIYGL